jgi:hypothetical protein
VLSVVASRCLRYGSALASAATLLAVAGFDPLNFAGVGMAAGKAAEASTQLAAYGAIPFLVSAVLLPRFDVLMLALLGHAVRAPPFTRAALVLP